MSVALFLSGGFLLELTITDNSQLGSKVSPVSSISLDGALRDGVQLVLKSLVAESLQWVGWKTGSGVESGKAIVLILLAEQEDTLLQLKELVNSGEAQKRLQGIYRAFGFLTNFRVSVKRIENSSFPSAQYSLFPALLHPVEQRDNLQQNDCAFKDTVKETCAVETMASSIPTLLENLKEYEATKVNIPPGEEATAKKMVEDYIRDGILKYIKENSAFIMNHHYTGSSYEGLKTEHADEVDIMVQVQHRDVTFQSVPQVPGYAVMVPNEGKNSPFYSKLLDSGFISPFEFLSRIFFGLVTKARNHVTMEPGVDMEVSKHGPAVQVDITAGGHTVSVDLVLCYMFDPNSHFVAKPFKEYADSEDAKKGSPYDTKLLWRQSFSLVEKELIKKMDAKDQGCRHRCVRVIKTIFRNDSTLKKLTSYHIKTAFLHYNETPGLSWKDSDLGDRFLALMEAIAGYIRNREMPHKFISNMNILDGFKETTMNNIQGRLDNMIKKLRHPTEQAKVFSSL